MDYLPDECWILKQSNLGEKDNAESKHCNIGNKS